MLDNDLQTWEEKQQILNTLLYKKENSSTPKQNAVMINND